MREIILSGEKKILQIAGIEVRKVYNGTKEWFLRTHYAEFICKSANAARGITPSDIMGYTKDGVPLKTFPGKIIRKPLPTGGVHAAYICAGVTPFPCGDLPVRPIHASINKATDIPIVRLQAIVDQPRFFLK